MTLSKQLFIGVAIAVVFSAVAPGRAHAAAPPLKPNEEIVKTKDGCGVVINSSSPSAKWEREGISKVIWGGACVDGLTMGEGLISNGFRSPNQPAMLPSTGSAWYGRRFGPSETRWDNGRTKKAFVWEGKGVYYNTLDTAAPVWSKDFSQYSTVGDSETSVSAVWFDKPAVMVSDVRNAKSVQHPCPDAASPKGCEALWAQHAGPVIERVKAFLAENEPKAKARMLEVQPLVAQWKGNLRPGDAEKRLADARRAGEQETQRASNKMKLDQECWDKDNKALTDSMTWKGSRSENDARLGRYLKELYEGPCKDHPNTKNGLARANQLLADAAKYKVEEDKQKAAPETGQAEPEQDRNGLRDVLGKVAVAAAGGTNSKERKQAALDALAGKPAADAGSDNAGANGSNGGGVGGPPLGPKNDGSLRWPREGGIEQWAGFSRPSGCTPDRFYVEPLYKKVESKIGKSLFFSEERNFYSKPIVNSFMKNPQAISIMQRDLDVLAKEIDDAYEVAGNVLKVSSNPNNDRAEIVNQIRSFQFENIRCDDPSTGTRALYFCGAILKLLHATEWIENSIQIACHMGIATPTYKSVRYTPEPQRVAPPAAAAPLPPKQQASTPSACAGDGGGASWTKCLVDTCAQQGGKPKVGACVACTGLPANWTRCPAGSGGVSSQQ